ncbi:GlxA family transcriptional regulator [Myxococcus sp. CA051A]|uniref:GlxA family transcriptional regulator n=1 Tax=Myxococcus llanfairpwllgwyngyllgogerychwyrndrobwllllantysiliogogogochensis TaxID=2590453 RepID=A0A540X6L5_9BACT|nr:MULTISPECIES: GlxA family transcriptional regulator [Myxococcus]NTX04570.1 GlxA family transcriptional regulator [Myxococcus sp. CA040A]NTX35924.1 GlxA family transcriptional regulator [Myxococcus sp. CA033]NTX63651.1 GlxA family transcriptional regulator [Myxococcus sp. CA051A]TQF16842.1 GlxA family transcriptional regulator [Myxococcus llanfairpwllgwyngyllgogerychwyrndrobwllllantysiliogogogochensis]
MAARSSSLHIAVLALEGCVASSVTGPLDVFAMANLLSREQGRSEPFTAELVSARAGPVRSFHGLELAAARVPAPTDCFDVVFVPAVIGNLEGSVAERSTADWLLGQHAKGAQLAAVCAGAFLLAKTGLLDGREATTHWGLAQDFEARYPRVALKPELLLVDHGDVLTAGGVTAYLDLCLHLVAKHASPELAALCAKMLLVEPGRRFQAPYAVHAAPRGHGDDAVLRAQEWLEAHLSGPVSLSGAAVAASLGERTLLRRFRKATGDTPLDYVQRLRVEAARRLLETTPRTVEDISQAVGYADTTSFRRRFKARTGLTPDAYRRRFALR